MIAIGSDHGGFALKQKIVATLTQHNIAFYDCGTVDDGSCDYPDYAKAVCQKIQTGEADKGILICGTGIGISIAANKIKGIRAALCHDCFSATHSRLHNDANVLALGERVIGAGLAWEIVQLFLKTPFEGGRHAQRVEKIMALECCPITITRD